MWIVTEGHNMFREFRYMNVLLWILTSCIDGVADGLPDGIPSFQYSYMYLKTDAMQSYYLNQFCYYFWSHNDTTYSVTEKCGKRNVISCCRTVGLFWDLKRLSLEKGP